MNIEFTNIISPTDYNGLRNAVGWKMLSERQTQNIIQNTKFLTAATIDNKPIAMSRVITDEGNIYFIADVIVHPDYQGQGIGKILMTNVMNFIKSDFVEGETVQVHLMSVKGKELFYEKFGFKKRPCDELGNGMTQWYTK